MFVPNIYANSINNAGYASLTIISHETPSKILE